MNQSPAGIRGEPDARERARPVRRADRGNGLSERRHRAPARPYSFGWLARFRRLARDYERLAETVEGLTFVAFACLLLQRLVHAFSS